MMIHQNRDFGISRIQTRKSHACYGMGVGIMILDQAYPGFPGDVRNASAYPFPVQYEIVRNVNTKNLVWDPEGRKECLEPIIQAAKNLEAMGCRAIAAECGYFALFQRETAAAVDVPVFMSSLLQARWAQALIGPDKVIGLLVASKKNLADSHLESVGLEIGSNYVVESANEDFKVEDFEMLWHPWERKPGEPAYAEYERAEKQFVEVGVNFYKSNPNMGALVLECTGYPPFARSLQRAIDIPVFSWSTLLDYAFSIVVHRDFYGHV